MYIYSARKIVPSVLPFLKHDEQVVHDQFKVFLLCLWSRRVYYRIYDTLITLKEYTVLGPILLMVHILQDCL